MIETVGTPSMIEDFRIVCLIAVELVTTLLRSNESQSTPNFSNSALIICLV